MQPLAPAEADEAREGGGAREEESGRSVQRCFFMSKMPTFQSKSATHNTSSRPPNACNSLSDPFCNEEEDEEEDKEEEEGGKEEEAGAAEQ
jgi:hypothetical protein